MKKRMEWRILFSIILTVSVLSNGYVREGNIGLSNLRNASAQSITKETVALNQKVAIMKVDEKIKLSIKGSNAKIQWSSSNKKVATVSDKGEVKGIKDGTATITAIVNNKKYQCKVYVSYYLLIKNKYIGSTDNIYFNKAKGWDKKDVIVIVEDPSIINVNNLFITPLKLGSTRVWVKYPDNIIDGYTYVVHNTFNHALKTGIYSELNTNQVKVAKMIRTTALKISEENKEDAFKVKAVFDWMCKNIAYDYPTYHHYLKTISDKQYQKHMKTFKYPQFDAYSLYGALLNNLAVCNGYTELFTCFMEVLDIPVKKLIGKEHAWNLVKLEDGWYHVDVTWGDNEVFESYDYEYLLFSNTMAQNIDNHTGAKLDKGEVFGKKYLEYFNSYTEYVNIGHIVDFSVLFADIKYNEELKDKFGNKDYFPEDNIITDIERRGMIVTSSDETIIKVDGTTIKAVGKGKAKVTVEILDEVINDPIFGKEVYSFEDIIEYRVY